MKATMNKEMTIWEILKKWQPNVRWLGNDITYDFSGGPFKVSCEQLGPSDYIAIINVKDSCRQLTGRGIDCIQAVYNAVHSQ